MGAQPPTIREKRSVRFFYKQRTEGDVKATKVVNAKSGYGCGLAEGDTIGRSYAYQYSKDAIDLERIKLR